MKRFLVLFILLGGFFCLFANTQNNQNEKIDEKLKTKVNNLQKPLYNPFVENYILHELKALRDENRDLKVELHETLAKKEVEISNNAISYATSTINNMFYILAAATSLLVIIGWTSLKDMNNNIKNIVDEKVSKIIQEYETRMYSVEKDLENRSRQVLKNQRDIEETNVIHSLWLRAAQESTLNGKVEIYDEILTIRPDDIEAIIYKADAVLDMGEAHWALSLANQALGIEESFPAALYQRAKVNCVLGFLDNAIDDLVEAVNLNEQYIFEIKGEEEFKDILDKEKVIQLLSKYEDVSHNLSS